MTDRRLRMVEDKHLRDSARALVEAGDRFPRLREAARRRHELEALLYALFLLFLA